MHTRPIHVLVVEDDDFDRLNIRRALQQAGLDLEVVFAEDHDSALEAARKKEFDCIFLDYNLPGATGIEVLASIRGCGNESPVIFITSHKDMRTAVEAMKSGALDFVSKDGLNSESLAQNIRYAIRLKKLTCELEESKRNLQTVIANSPIVLFSLNREGYFTVFDGKGSIPLGVDPVSIVNQHISICSETVPVAEELFLKGLSGISDRVVTAVGDRSFEICYSPIFGEDQEIKGVIGVASDVTILLKAKQEAEEAARLKQQFLANMSHEIRTPMNGIIGLTNILLETPANDEQKGYLQSIKSCSDNLLVIINDILDFSKVESGKMTFENVPFRISDIAGQTVELFKMKAAENSVQLRLDIDPLVPIAVSGDPTRLSQILNNLVSNAVKFTENGRVDISIRSLRESGSRSTLAFEVKDSGIGITKEALPHIFESFRQASSDTTRKYGGTGLGLSIVKRLVELQNGKIEVKSTPGNGTTFLFLLTFERLEERSLQGTKTDCGSEKCIQGVKVLLAEDNKVNQLIAKKLLTDWGAKVETADNGREAVEKLQKGTFDIVLMDIQMPEMNGHMATEIIRTTLQEPYKSVPVMAMTAHATRSEKEKCLACGMNDYISKPFEPEELRNLVHTLTKSKGAAYNDTRSDGSAPIMRIEKQTREESKRPDPTLENYCVEDAITGDYRINLSYLKQVSDGNDEFIIEMIEMFLNKTPRALEEMNQHFNQRNWEELRQIAHRIKPSFTYIGLPDIQKALGEIERLTAVSDPKEAKTVSSLLVKVDNASRLVFRQLKQELDSLR